MLAFEHFRLDVRRRDLWAGETLVELQPRQFDMLVCLIEHRHQTLSRAALQEKLWPGLAIGDKVVPVHISLLRKSLDQHGGKALVVSGTGGYRFVGDVSDTDAVASVADPVMEATDSVAEPPAIDPSPPRTQRQRIVAGLVVLTAIGLGIAGGWLWRARGQGAPALSIAVLPFRNLTEGGSRYMADAVTEDLNTDLAHIPGSFVTSLGSTEEFREHHTPVSTIGRVLNVRYLVDGSLRAADGVYLIDTALIEAASGQEVWTRRFQTPQAGLAATQAQIVRLIASALDVELPAIVSASSLHDRPDNPRAEDLFFQAYSRVQSDDTLAGYAQAQRLLEHALRLQPDFGDALAELGLTMILRLQSAEDPTADADLSEARDVIAHALRTTHGAIALAANARLLEYEQNCAQAVPSAQAARALEPNNIDALAVLARCASDLGQLDQAAGYLRTVLQLNPDAIRGKPRLALLSQVYLLQGRYTDAIETGNQALAGDSAPQAGAEAMGRAEYVRLMIMAATALGGDVDGARAQYAAYRAIWPHRSAWRVAAMSQRRVAALPGFARFISGLTQAGMPMYADRTGVDAAGSETVDGDFAPTPEVIDGATTVDTRAVAALIARGGSTVLDLGRGTAAPAGAIKVVQQGNGLGSLDAPPDKHVPIVVMGDGMFGSAPVHAVRTMVRGGYTRVMWYRGGEEAWAEAGLTN